MDTNENNPNKLNESQGSYSGSKKITIFRSMEEENQYTHRQYASMTPEECLAEVTRMRLTAYPNLNTNLKPWGSTVYFD